MGTTEGHLYAVEALLDAGASTELRTAEWNRALDAALDLGHTTIANTLSNNIVQKRASRRSMAIPSKPTSGPESLSVCPSPALAYGVYRSPRQQAARLYYLHRNFPNPGILSDNRTD
jgi:hypothetical protein